MDGTLTFSGQVDLDQEPSTPGVLTLVSDNDMIDKVNAAKRVIAPLGPIASFAARSPWTGLEDRSFDHVARWLKEIRDVDMYPSASMLQQAKSRGEIDARLFEQRLQVWLDSQSLKLPRDVAERFCRSALQLDDLPASALRAPELEALAKKMNSLALPVVKSQPTQTLSFRVEQHSGVLVEHELNRHMIKWSKLFLDESSAAWSLPNRKEGFYRAWHRVVQRDPALSRAQRQRLRNIPQNATSALKEALSALEISVSQIQAYLEAHLLSLPGWAGMMLWRSQESPQEASLITEYLAVRISLEWALIQPYMPIPEYQADPSPLLTRLLTAWFHWGDVPIDEWANMSSTQQRAYLALAHRFDDVVRKRLWLEAWEQTYEERLQKLVMANRVASNVEKPVSAQVALCIDTRSEPFRRALEKAGPFETFGVAGFFNLPIETCELGSTHSHPSLPVMLKPTHKVTELASEVDSDSYQLRRQALHSVKHTFRTMKQNMLTSLLLPEVSGPWLSLKMLGRGFFPRRAGRSLGKLKQEWLQKPSTELSLDYAGMESGLQLGFSDEEKVYLVQRALQMMGLTEGFAPLVVICGHGSHTTNNPYAAALDCGACGGASGGFNARVLATLCNHPKVREALENEGISIPQETVFAAAEHITTVNELRWLYVPELSDVATEAFQELQEALPEISHHVNEEQLSRLPNLGFSFNDPKYEMQRFAEDWSEVRPEWGLAGNAAFIIGTRRLTEECDLDGRVFLHTYDWKQDRDGAILANIISGPATVAQWINLQYYASTVAPHYYGSGNKATQTVTAGIGVMQGNGSDLLSGLPWQSVMKSDEEFYHAPLRLLVVIEAPREQVQQLLNRDGAFRQKVQHGWIRLATIDSKGCWENWHKQ